MKKRFVILILLLVVGFTYAQQDLYLSLKNTKAKPIAMGGAYCSIEDNIVSAAYNPASLNLYQNDKNFRLTFFLNPITPVILLNDRYENDSPKQTNATHYFKDATALIQGIALTIKFIDIGLIFNEQIIDRNELLDQKSVFENNNLWNNSYHTLITRIKLAEKVNIGASATLFQKEQNDVITREYGYSYGILLKPSPKMNAGITYHYFPQSLSKVRVPVERLFGQTVNVGISYRPFTGTTLSMDLRNLTEETNKSKIQPHFGLEQRVLSIFALRGGFYEQRETHGRYYSAGIGLIDSNLFFSKENELSQSQFMLNYSIAFQKEADEMFRWHVISLLIRI